MVWAFAMAGVTAPRLFEAVAAEAVIRVAELTMQELANIVWAFACAGWQQNQIFRELGSALMERFDDLNDAQKSQLYLVTLYAQMEWRDQNFPLSSQLQSLRAASTAAEPEPSQFQRAVSAGFTV